MEKRKLLLVAVSVGVFLVIVLSAAILIFTPNTGGPLTAGRAGSPPAASAPIPAGGLRGPASADAVEMVRNPGELQGLKIPPPGVPAVSVVSEGAAPPSGTPGKGPGESGRGASSASAVQENNFYFNGEASARSPAAERGKDGPAQVVISVPKPSAPGVPTTGARPAPAGSPKASASSQGQRESPPAAAAPAGKPASGAASAAAPAKSPTAAAVSAAAPAKSPAAAAAPAKSPASPGPARSAPAKAAPPAPRSQKDYWIQTGAFSALIRAEDAKETLASKGLSSIIDDREVDGQTWYRVRVGPYTSENEANYWLALVRAIDGFDGSQVRSTQR